MNPTPSDPTDNSHCPDTDSLLAIATLTIYEHERLAFTEIPLKKLKTRKRAADKSTLLRAIYCFVLSR